MIWHYLVVHAVYIGCGAIFVLGFGGGLIVRSCMPSQRDVVLYQKSTELAFIAKRINDSQHAGIKIAPSDWSDLYTATLAVLALEDDYA